MTATLLSLILVATPDGPTKPQIAAKPPTILVQADEIKPYDSNALQTMLNTMVTSLNGLLGGSNSVFSPTTLVSALGNFQGSTSNSTFSQFQALAQLPNWPMIGSPVSTSVAQTVSSGTPAVGSTAAVPGSTSTVTTTNTAATAPAPAAPVSLSQFFGTNPTLTAPSGPSAMGPSSQDLLQQQANLSYDIVNLALLLGGALSDQYSHVGYDKTTGLLAYRGQAVIGFPIYLQPDAKVDLDATAVVHVRLSPTTAPGTARNLKLTNVSPTFSANLDKQDKNTLTTLSADSSPVSLEGLYPREKTYNIAQITSKTSGFSAGALLSFLGIGYSNFGQKQNLFLVRDTDTMAVSEPTSEADKKKGIIQFCWKFHPVQGLGQHLVSAGTRQVFVQVALPTVRGANCALTADVWTEWVKPNGVVIDQGPPVKDQYVEIPSFTPTASASSVVAAPAADSATVRLGGQFYQNSTTLVLGPSSYSNTQGLAFESEDAVRLATTLESLMQFDPIVYGSLSAPTTYCLPLNGGTPIALTALGTATGVTNRPIRNVRVSQHGANSDIMFDLGRTAMDSPDPVVMLNGKVYGRGPNPIAITRYAAMMLARVTVPTADLVAARGMQVNTDFWGPNGSQVVPVPYPSISPLPTASFLGVKRDGSMMFALSGANFDQYTKITVMDRDLVPVVISATMLRFTLSSRQFAQNAQIIVQQFDYRHNIVGEPMAVALPSPTLTKAYAVSPTTYAATSSAIAITITGPNLINLKQIAVGSVNYTQGMFGTAGKFQFSPDYSTAVLSVTFPTAQSNYPILLEFKDGSIFTLNFAITKAS